MSQHRFAMHKTWKPVFIIAIALAVGALLVAHPRRANADQTDIAFGSVDLTVTSAKYMYLPAHTYPFKAGWYLVATVKNTSAFNINQPFKVFLATTDQPAIVLDWVTLGGLAAGASKGIPFPMPACSSTLSRRVHVDAQHQISESNENNNILTWVHNCG